MYCQVLLPSSDTEGHSSSLSVLWSLSCPRQHSPATRAATGAHEMVSERHTRILGKKVGWQESGTQQDILTAGKVLGKF